MPHKKTIRGQNDLNIAIHLSARGPKFVLLHKTKGFFRLNSEVYFDASVASLILSLALKHNGMASATFEDLITHWVACGSKSVWLLSRILQHEQRASLLRELLTRETTKALRSRLIDEATSHGEWRVLMHDGTFKTLFSVIGQAKMAQTLGESHVLHTFMGTTGAFPGASLQPKEDPEHFKLASCEVLPEDVRAQAEIMYNDRPSDLEDCRDVFPNLRFLVEDGLHLVIRVEWCFGKKRVAMTHTLLLRQS